MNTNSFQSISKCFSMHFVQLFFNFHLVHIVELFIIKSLKPTNCFFYVLKHFCWITTDTKFIHLNTSFDILKIVCCFMLSSYFFKFTKYNIIKTWYNTTIKLYDNEHTSNLALVLWGSIFLLSIYYGVNKLKFYILYHKWYILLSLLKW